MKVVVFGVFQTFLAIALYVTFFKFVSIPAKIILELIVLFNIIVIDPDAIRKYSLFHKFLRPLWWFGNDDDPVDGGDGHDGYLPGKSLWYRKLRWAIRNPFNNFDRYVIGFWDKQKWLGTVGRKFWPYDGKKTMIYFPHFTKIDGRWKIITPWISVRLSFMEGYVGWKPSGEFGVALRKARSRSY